MNQIQKQNIKLLNLVEYGFSFRQIQRVLLNSINTPIYKEEIIQCLGNTPSIIKLANASMNFDRSYFSLWCLIYFDVNFITIEKLKKNFKSLDDLALRKDFFDSLSYQVETSKRVKIALDELSLNYCSNLKNELLNEISENEPIQNNRLKIKILNKYSNVTSQLFDETIDYLLSGRKIILCLEGYRISQVTVTDYLKNSDIDKDLIVLRKCQGESLEKIGQEKGLTRERIRQIINNRIKSLPIFYDEIKYYGMLSSYKFTSYDINLLNLDSCLVEYIYLKYKIDTPEKDMLDYLRDNKLYETSIGKKYLGDNKLIEIDGELLKINFINLFYKFILKSNIFSFKFNNIIDKYNKFINSLNIFDSDCKVTEEDKIVKMRKLENHKNFLCVSRDKFVVFQEDKLSSEFIERLKDYLDTVDGYCSVKYFFNQYKLLCEKNHINDEFELFVLCKKLFCELYKDKIDFIRNPVICIKNINKDEYIEEMISDMTLPCTVDEFIDYVYFKTALNKKSVSLKFSHIINKYKNKEGLLSLDCDYTDDEAELLIDYLEDKECIGYTLFELNMKKMFKDKYSIFMNANILKRFNFNKTNTSVYHSKYSNRIEAVKNCLSEMDLILTTSMIEKICKIEFLTYKVYDAINECLVIKIGNNKFLNMVARNEQELMINLKEKILDSCEEIRIYVLNEFLESNLFKDILNSNILYKDVLYSYDIKEIIKFLISTSFGFNTIIQGDTFIFSKSELSFEIIISSIMNEYEIIGTNELKEVLYEKFGITKSFTNSELANMGYYCPYTSEKIYLSKEYYELEMEELLNENNGS